MEQQEQNPFVINENDLANEWLKQPQLTRKMGDTEAQVRHLYNFKKAALDVIEAQQRLAIRKNPHLFGLPDKSNESVVEATLTLTKEYQQSLADLNKAKFELDIATTDTVAMIDRRKTLERLVDLLQINYFSEKEPQATTPEAREHIKNQQRKLTRTQD